MFIDRFMWTVERNLQGLPRENLYQLCRGRIEVFFKCRAESPEDPWEFIGPVGTGPEGGFHCRVRPLDQTICLWVVSRCSLKVCTQKF